jgi:cobalt/nickel transport system permease protein
MHMADALLSPAVGGIMCAVSAASVVYSAAKVKKDELGEKKVPIMAVTGAFVFAAQMINFTIPATGSSGHIGGGILLSAVLGPFPALLSIAAVLIIQCLFFADGGLLALGCNIFNMGVIPCLIIYPLIYRPILRKGADLKRISASSVLSVVVGLELGAFAVVLQTLASGITELPFAPFVALMLPIHLAIGLIEGIVTAAIVSFIYKMRPEIITSAVSGASLGKKVSIKKWQSFWPLRQYSSEADCRSLHPPIPTVWNGRWKRRPVLRSLRRRERCIPGRLPFRTPRRLCPITIIQTQTATVPFQVRRRLALREAL